MLMLIKLNLMLNGYNVKIKNKIINLIETSVAALISECWQNIYINNNKINKKHVIIHD